MSLTRDSNGIGLGNVINRLKLYYDRDNIFHIHSDGRNKGTTVTMLIPKEHTSDNNNEDEDIERSSHV